MEYQLNKSIFSSNQDYFCRHSISDNNEMVSNEDVKALVDSGTTLSTSLLYKLINTLKSNDENKQSILTVGFQLIYKLLPLLSSSDLELQTCAYLALQLLGDQLDGDELVENMMDQLICMDWELNNEEQFLKKTLLFIEYIELFGRGLEKTTRARDWMLFLPFLANNIAKTMDIIESILIEKSIYSSHPSKTGPTDWDQAVVLLTHACLDVTQFIHSKTVAKEFTDFPLSTNDIGSEDGDTKRRYLGYFLLSSLFEKVISNLDMQLSKIYFEKFHAMYNIKRPISQQQHNIENEVYKDMFDIIHRCSNLAFSSGFTFDRMFQLLNSINEKDHYHLSLEDRLSDDDRQMINSRLYPLSYKGIGTLVSISLYDKLIYPFAFNTHSIGLFPSEIVDMDSFSKKYIGIMLNLLTRSSDMICQADKGIFCLLYLSDRIKTRMIMDDIEKSIQGPCGGEDEFPAARIIEIISSVASTCPDPSIRFLAYKLVEKFLDFGNDETKVFFLIELLDRCPFPSMKTASIGLLKDQINQSFKTKDVSIFTSPFIVHTFFPIIFNFKSSWKEEFWDDYNHIIQALNLYLYLLMKDKARNLTTIWNSDKVETMDKNYIQPLLDLLNGDIKPNKDIHLQEMQIDIMKDVIEKIMTFKNNK